MDQVSRPLIIVLASTIVLAALWLVALRPKAPDVADTPAAPVTAIAKAKDASAASDAANAKVQAAIDRSTGETPATGAATPATGAATPAQGVATPAGSAKPTTTGKQDASIAREVRAGKVVVMLFWNAKGADDVATRGVVRGLARHGGNVVVHVIPISRVGRYETVTKGVTINQSPTTLVIGRKGATRSIVGLTERGELTQAVGDALAGRR